MRRGAAGVAAACAVLLAGCGSSGDGGLTVFAASSLREALPRVDPDGTYVFAGSDELAAQIRDGAGADVIVTAGPGPMDQLVAAGLVEAPVAFARNTVVIAVPRSTTRRVASLADLAQPGLKIVLGDEGVPIGDYARSVIAAAEADGVLGNVVSFERDAKGVLGKVALGEADAGIVYATDVRAAGDEVVAVPIPDELQPDVRYFVAVVRGSERAEEAGELVERLAGPEGAGTLRAAGFLPVAR